MEKNTLTTMDLVQQAIDNNPSKLGDTFNDIIMTKIVDAVAAKKQELQQTMFGPDSDEVEHEQSEEDQVEDNLEQQDEEDEDDDEQNIEPNA